MPIHFHAVVVEDVVVEVGEKPDLVFSEGLPVAAVAEEGIRERDSSSVSKYGSSFKASNTASTSFRWSKSRQIYPECWMMALSARTEKMPEKVQ